MKILFWNIRGLGAAGRRKLLVELLQKHEVCCNCLQETIKNSFKPRELERFALGRPFSQDWVLATRHSGGLLLGLDTVDGENVTNSYTQNTVNILGFKGRITCHDHILSITSSPCTLSMCMQDVTKLEKMSLWGPIWRSPDLYLGRPGHAKSP